MTDDAEPTLADAMARCGALEAALEIVIAALSDDQRAAIRRHALLLDAGVHRAIEGFSMTPDEVQRTVALLNGDTAEGEA